MKKRLLLTACITAAAGTFALAPAFAPARANEPYFPRGKGSFDRADANKDGKIELPEFASLTDRRMARIDGNGDKTVTVAEIDAKLQEALKRRRDRIMALLDANGDGAITESELDNVLEAMFNGADQDKDGGLTMPEIKDFKRGQWRKAYLQAAGN